jgi:hypothetical protein
MRQGLAPRAKKLQKRAKLHLEELEARNLLSSTSLPAFSASNDFLADGMV